MIERNKKLNKNQYTEKISENTIYDDKIPLKKGDSVLVKSLNQKGHIVSDVDSSTMVTVQIGIVKTKVKKSDLIKIKSEEEEKNKNSVTRMVSIKNSSIYPIVDLRGMNLDEAIMKVDKYLDDALMSNLNEVQIIHGKGTGVLRDGITKFLKKHRHIKTSRLGNFNEGGDGVTIVTFK